MSDSKSKAVSPSKGKKKAEEPKLEPSQIAAGGQYYFVYSVLEL